MRSNKLYENKKTDRWLDDVITIFDGKWIRNADGIIDVIGSVFMTDDTKKILVQFGHVSKDFRCNRSINMTSLEGSPKYVGSDFVCSGTNIKSLKGIPQWIGNRLICCYNTNITDPYEYRYALFSIINGEFVSKNQELDDIINKYGYDGTLESKRRVVQGLKLLKELKNEL